jgi:serine/threonine protein kinase
MAACGSVRAPAPKSSIVMAAPQNPPEPAGSAVGLVHRVAQSPLGELWLALDQRRGTPGEPLLLRYVSLSNEATPDAVERVVAAARAAMNLRHELLLPALEVQQEPLAVAYPYVEALPLSALQSSARVREVLFPVGVCLRLIIDLLRALQALHESWRGWPLEVPYGGLLPASVLVSRDGRTRLCDGLVASSALLQRGFDFSAAELSYRAPEQVYASVAPEPATDVFIAAILLWELLSGRRLLSGPKELVERKLLEHDLPPARADLRPDCQMSRGLIELLDSSLALAPQQRPPTPGALATALERCGHVVASHAEVAAFVHELVGPQLNRLTHALRVAAGYATDDDRARLAVVVPSESPAAALESRARALAPSAQPAARSPSGTISSNGTARSLAAAVAQAIERRSASGQFPAFDPRPGDVAPGTPSLGSLAAAQPRTRTTLIPKSSTLTTETRSSVPPPQALPRPGSTPSSPAPHRDDLVDTSAIEEEEKTTVLRAVRDPAALRGVRARAPAQSPSLPVRGAANPSPPVRLAPKRALLAALAGVVLLIQLWMFVLARSSHPEKARSTPPNQRALSSE